MKIILALVLISSVFCNTQPKQIKTADIQNFVLGFALGLGVLNEIPDIVGCGTSALGAKAAITAAIHDIESGDFDKIISGVQAITGLLDTLSNSCGEATLEGVAYFNTIKAIVTDAHFFKTAQSNVLKNLKVTVADIVAITKSDDWVLKGAYAGDVAKIVLFGEPNEQ